MSALTDSERSYRACAYIYVFIFSNSCVNGWIVAQKICCFAAFVRKSKIILYEKNGNNEKNAVYSLFNLDLYFQKLTSNEISWLHKFSVKRFLQQLFKIQLLNRPSCISHVDVVVAGSLAWRWGNPLFPSTIGNPSLLVNRALARWDRSSAWNMLTLYKYVTT